MPDILEIRSKLLNAEAALSQLKRAVARDPHSVSLELLQLNLEKNFRSLEAEFIDAAEDLGLDVCSYKVTSPTGSMRIKPIGLALADYQTLVTLVYDAQKNGPKKSAKLAFESVEDTSLDFGYTFSGSTGFVLTVKNEKLLGIESELDAAIGTVFEMSGLRTPVDVRDYAKRLGPAPLRQLYKWVQDHADSGYGAEIDWRRGREVRKAIAMAPADFDVLETAIKKTSKEVQRVIALDGVLAGIDFKEEGIREGTFHFKTEGGQEVRGKFSESAELPEVIGVPSRYRATIARVSRTVFYKDKDERDYYLLKLSENT